MTFKVIDNKISKFKGNIVPTRFLFTKKYKLSRFLFTTGNINSVLSDMNISDYI